MEMGKRQRKVYEKRAEQSEFSLPFSLLSSSTLSSTVSHSSPLSLFSLSFIDIYIFFINKIN